MTPSQQSRADHLALVAAPILATTVHHACILAERGEVSESDIARICLPEHALDIAQRLQRAAEERVKT